MNSTIKHFNLLFIGSHLFFSTFLFLLITIFPKSLPAQECSSDIVLTSQDAIDSFNCTKVTGSLTISEAVEGNITNLDGLAALTRVGFTIGDTQSFGDLIIRNNDALTNIDGLATLHWLGRSIYIEDNNALDHCGGLYPLFTIGMIDYGQEGDLEINGNLPGCNSVDEILGCNPRMIEVQAEDYDIGVQHVAYFDKTPGNTGGQYRYDDVDIWKYGSDTFYTGANATSEWLAYTIDIPHDGLYRLYIHAATPYDSRLLRVELDGMYIIDSLPVPNTGGWTNWQTLSVDVKLKAGQQTMRLVIEKGGFNIDSISMQYIPSNHGLEFKPCCGTFIDPVEVSISTPIVDGTIYYTTDGSPPYEFGPILGMVGRGKIYNSPFTLTNDTTLRAVVIECDSSDTKPAYCWLGSGQVYRNYTIVQYSPLTIQAEDYNSYFDKTPGNTGGQYRYDDVDIWKYGSDTFYTGANATGEWLAYPIELPISGEYRLGIRLATPNNNRQLRVLFENYLTTDTITVQNTGGWTNWQTLNANVWLNSGQQEMRLLIDYGGFNVDWISLEYIGN